MTALAGFTQENGKLNNNGFLFEWDQNKKKEVEQGKVLFRQAKYNENRKVVDIENGELVEHFTPELEGFKIMPTELTEGKFAFRIHDETGDQRLMWDSRYNSEVEEAAERFDELMKKGCKAYAVMPNGENGRRIYGFNAELEEVYFDEKKESLGTKLKKFIEDFGEIVVLPKTHPG